MDVIKLVIVGAGALAEEAFLFSQERPNKHVNHKIDVVGFLGRAPKGEKEIFGVPVAEKLGDLCIGGNGPTHFVCAIGNNETRKKVCQEIEAETKLLPWSIIHPTTVLGPDVHMAPGCIVEPFVVIGPHVTVGPHTILNTGSTIGHGSLIGSFVHVCPGVRLGGDCTVGDNVLLGSNAVIYPSMRIGNSATVGAGSFVLRPLGKGKTVFGNPAKLMR